MWLLLLTELTEPSSAAVNILGEEINTKMSLIKLRQTALASLFIYGPLLSVARSLSLSFAQPEFSPELTPGTRLTAAL